MVFLVVVGVLQFTYCIIAGNYVCSALDYLWNLCWCHAAIQCFLGWIFSDCGTVCINWYVLYFDVGDGQMADKV